MLLPAQLHWTGSSSVWQLKAAASPYMNTMNEVGNGVMVSEEGNSLRALIPAFISLLSVWGSFPSKPSEGEAEKTRRIDKAGSSIAPVIRRPSLRASGSGDKDGWGCHGRSQTAKSHVRVTLMEGLLKKIGVLSVLYRCVYSPCSPYGSLTGQTSAFTLQLLFDAKGLGAGCSGKLVALCTTAGTGTMM